MKAARSPNYQRLPSVTFLLAFGIPLFAADPTSIPLAAGTLLVEADLVNFAPTLSSATLIYKITNRTSVSWRDIQLRFDIGALCNGEPRQWSFSADHGLISFSGDFAVTNTGTKVVPLSGKLDRCKTEIVNPVLLVADSWDPGDHNFGGQVYHIHNKPPSPSDLAEQLRIINIQRDAEASAEAERQRKEDAVEAERQKKLAAERLKKQAEQGARAARLKSEEDAKVANEQAKLRASCNLIYKATADKKQVDLTVRELIQIQDCRSLGLYTPK